MAFVADFAMEFKEAYVEAIVANYPQQYRAGVESILHNLIKRRDNLSKTSEKKLALACKHLDLNTLETETARLCAKTKHSSVINYPQVYAFYANFVNPHKPAVEKITPELLDMVLVQHFGAKNVDVPEQIRRTQRASVDLEQLSEIYRVVLREGPKLDFQPTAHL